jgi:hypothetical protein
MSYRIGDFVARTSGANQFSSTLNMNGQIMFIVNGDLQDQNGNNYKASSLYLVLFNNGNREVVTEDQMRLVSRGNQPMINQNVVNQQVVTKTRPTSYLVSDAVMVDVSSGPIIVDTPYIVDTPVFVDAYAAPYVYTGPFLPNIIIG